MDGSGASSGTTSESFLTAEPQDVLFRWLQQRIHIPRTDNFWAFGLVRGGELAAVVGYQWDNGASCFMHVALDSPRALTRKVLGFAFHYPFNIRKLNMVLGYVPSCNERALRLNSRVGFEVLAEIPGAHPYGSQVLMGLRRENCRWLELANVRSTEP